MITIKKQGRWGVFAEELPKKLEAALFNRLAYQKEGWEVAVKMKRMQASWSWVRFYNRKKRCFPWGLLDRVLKILDQWHEQNDHSESTMPVINSGFLKIDYNDHSNPESRPYQNVAIESLIENQGGIVSAPCGSGKTWIMINFLKKLKFKKALIIVPTLFLKIQWKKQIENINADVINYQSLKDLKILKNYDVLIFDETHIVAASTIYKIAISFGEGIVCGCSATPFRNYLDEGMKLTAALGEIVFNISIRELIDKGYLCDADVKIVSLDKIEEEYWDTYPDLYQKGIVENEERNNKIIEIAKKESKKGMIFITVEKIQHGEILIDKLKDESAVFINGSTKNREQLYEDIQNNKYKIIVTTRVFDLGVDFKHLYCLIIGNGGKSGIRVIQQMGRALRIHPDKKRALIIDFEDDCKYLKKRFQRRYEILKKDFKVDYYK